MDFSFMTDVCGNGTLIKYARRNENKRNPTFVSTYFHSGSVNFGFPSKSRKASLYYQMHLGWGPTIARLRLVGDL